MLADIVKKTPKELPITRLADGLVPPTNRWFSGLVFGDKAAAGLPDPAELRADRRRLRLRAADDDHEREGHPGRLQARDGHGLRREEAKVSAYDTLTVTLDHLDAAASCIGKTTIVQGSPYVRFTAETATEITAHAAHHGVR